MVGMLYWCQHQTEQGGQYHEKKIECICVYHEPFLFGWKNIVFPLIGWAVVCVIAFIFRAYHRRKKAKEQQHQFIQSKQ